MPAMTLFDCPYIKVDAHGWPFVHQTDEQAYLDWCANNPPEECGSQYDDDTVDEMEAAEVEEMRLNGVCPY